ncbi:MAG: hypothetical protein ACLSDQ_01050 [Adlercreutzia equolifaciens]
MPRRLCERTRDRLTSAQDGLSAASTAAEKALTTADASYDAVARAADEAFAAMKDDPAAAQTSCRLPLGRGARPGLPTMRDTLAGPDPTAGRRRP